MRFPNIISAENRVNQLEAASLNKPLFAIRKKNSCYFLPRPPSGQKGGSWVEPRAATTAQPRFFPTKRATKGFLTQWLKGPVLSRHSQDFSGDDEVCLEHRPDLAESPRMANDFEIVEIFWGVKG